MDASDFIEVDDGNTANDVSTPAPSVIAFIADLRAESARLQRARGAFENPKAGISGLALELLVCGVARLDYPSQHDSTVFKRGFHEIQKNSTRQENAGERSPLIVDDSFLKSHLDVVFLVIDTALDALRAGELSLAALYKANQPTRPSWGNLPPILLSRAATLEANTFFRGRLFE